MELSLEGTLKEVFDEVRPSPSFIHRDFLLEITGQYPQLILFRLTQSRVELINKYKIGDPLKVYFNINGKEWTNDVGKRSFFTNLIAYRLSSKVNDNGNTPLPPAIDEPGIGTSEDDLPF